MSQRISIDMTVQTAATLEEALDKIGPTVTKNSGSGLLLRSLSHAIDPAADPSDRWSVIAVFTTVGDGDLPAEVSTPEVTYAEE